MKVRKPSHQDSVQSNDPIQASSEGASFAPPPLQLTAAPENGVIQREENESGQETLAPSYTPLDSMGSVGADGNMSVASTRTVTTNTAGDDPNGAPLYSSSTAVGANASFNPTNGRVGGGLTYSQTDEIQNADGPGTTSNSTSVGANGYVDLNSSGQLEGAGGSASVTSNGRSVTLGGGIVVSAVPPRARNGRWTVSWTRSVSGNLGGGMTSGNRGGSASVSLSDAITGSRSFATQEEAQTFYAGTEWHSIDPENAAELGQGDTINETSGGNLQFGANGKLMGASIGASITVGTNRSVQVTGLGDRRISVRVTDTAILGGAATMGAPGIGLSLGVQDSSSEGQIVTFDLNTSAGRGSYQYLVSAGSLLGSGYTMVAETESDSWQETAGVNILGAAMTNTSTTTEATTTYESGRTVEERTGNESTNITIPLIGSYSASDQIVATDDSDASNRAYTVSSTVNASSTSDVNSSLARSTGVYRESNPTSLDNQSDRRWNVTSTFSHQQVERLISQMRAGRFNYHTLIHQSGHGSDFLSEVQAAGSDWDRIDRALSDFIAETGDQGLALIRNTIGTTPSYNLELEGDPYMRGETGHSELAGQVRGFERRLSRSSNLASLGTQIGRVLGQQRERVTAISDPSRYPDLPQELRHREVRRSEREIETLEDLRSRALAAFREQQSASESESEAVSSSQEGPEEALYSEEGGMTEAPVPEVLESVNIWGNVDMLADQATSKRAEAVEAGNVARRHHSFQVDGAWCYHRSAIETWGYDGIFSDGDHLSQYQRAQSNMDSAHTGWARGESAWNDYQTRRSELEFSASSQDQIDSALDALLRRALSKYGFAKQSFMQASAIYERIRTLHPDRRNDQFRGYTDGKRLASRLRLR